MKKHIPIGLLILTVSFVVGGCATSGFESPVFSESGIPNQRYMVGGGFEIAYKAPSPGTAYVVETRTANIIKTQSLEEGQRFEFDIGAEPEEIEAILGIPFSEVRLHLYFVPSPLKR
jgi:hypothetical protein